MTSAQAVLVHEYRFDGNADDSVGTAHGTLVGGANVIAGAVQLDGVADVDPAHVQLPGPDIAINTFDEVTLELWSSQPTANQDWSMTAGFGSTWGNGAGQDYLMIATTRGEDVSRAAIAATQDETDPFLEEVWVDGPELNDGLVHHYVATVDATEISYYIDGELQGTAALDEFDHTTALSELSNDFAYLGRSLYNADPPVQGSIHEFSIWDNAMAAEDVQTEFANGPVGGAGVGPALEVNRDTGEVRFTNDTGSIDLVRYSITSEAGAIAEGNWESITETGDADSGGSIDDDDVWEIITRTANDITEQDPLGGGGPDDGAPLTASISLGEGLWTPTYIEDLEAEVIIFDGVNETSLGLPVFYVGNDDEPFSRSDFNLDGTVDEDDYDTLLANNLTELTGTTPLETHAEGDTNGDLVNDFQDFRNFQIDFDAVNGEGAFAAMVSGTAVPEPASGVMLGGIFLATLLGWRTYRRESAMQPPRTRRLVSTLAALAVTCLAHHTATADTVAHWDFETDLIAGSAADGQVVSHPSDDGVFDGALQDLSGNGNTLSAFTGTGGETPAFGDMFFSSNVSSSNRTGSTLSIEGLAEGTCCPGLFNDGTGSDGDLKFGGSDVGVLPQWTIEASVNFKDPNGWQTIVGKDGIGQQTGTSYNADGTSGGGDALAAPLYFQNNGIDNRFRINFTANDGNTYIVDSQTIAQPDEWYNMAVTSDGTTLSLYVNGILENSIDMVAASGSSDTGMIALDESGFEGDGETVPYTWSVTRGMYNDGHVDRLNGFIDDVRISNEALSVDEFLNSFVDGIQLFVNTDNGMVSIRNTADEPHSLDYYQIESAAESLIASDFNGTTGWDSLSDQNVDPVDDGQDSGETWDESAGSSSGILAELFLKGESVLGPGESLSLGAAYGGAGNDGDLQFSFSEKDGDLTVAPVFFVSSLPGDFNLDGVVDLADYTVWRDNLGAANDGGLNGNGDGVGPVDSDDYELWKQNFGGTAAAAGSLSPASVPEPTTGLLAMLAAGIGLAAFRRR